MKKIFKAPGRLLYKNNNKKKDSKDLLERKKEGSMDKTTFYFLHWNPYS